MKDMNRYIFYYEDHVLMLMEIKELSIDREIVVSVKTKQNKRQKNYYPATATIGKVFILGCRFQDTKKQKFYYYKNGGIRISSGSCPSIIKKIDIFVDESNTNDAMISFKDQASAELWAQLNQVMLKD